MVVEKASEPLLNYLKKLIGAKCKHTWSLVKKMSLEVWTRASLTDKNHLNF